MSSHWSDSRLTTLSGMLRKLFMDKSKTMEAGFSRYWRHRLEKRHMVAPSMNRWSADQLMFRMRFSSPGDVEDAQKLHVLHVGHQQTLAGVHGNADVVSRLHINGHSDVLLGVVDGGVENGEVEEAHGSSLQHKENRLSDFILIFYSREETEGQEAA
ncbi:hypothetical protein CRUP_030318 [Coryphaenoides rupestris]|nr:hypothetical protein CRUP_030318 [Coryphaenoides rupestris]